VSMTENLSVSADLKTDKYVQFSIHLGLICAAGGIGGVAYNLSCQAYRSVSFERYHILQEDAFLNEFVL
jgi:hypothetical protein